MPLKIWPFISFIVKTRFIYDKFVKYRYQGTEILIKTSKSSILNLCIYFFILFLTLYFFAYEMKLQKKLNLEMMQKFVNLYGINNKLDKVCLYMIHYYISRRTISSYPSKILPLINKIIFSLDDFQKRIFEDIVLSEAGLFIGKTGMVVHFDESIHEKVLFEYSDNFSLSWRICLFDLQYERGVQSYDQALTHFKRLYYEYSSISENIPELMAILRKRLIFHSLNADEYFFFIEEMMCELVDFYHHDKNFSCRTTHRGYLTEEIFEYPEAITALVSFMMELQASKLLCTQKKKAKAVKDRLIKLGWSGSEKNL